MEEKYILDNNLITTDISDKLDNGYWINKLIIHFNKEIENLNYFDFIFIGHDKGGTIFEIITKYYYNNIVEIIIPPIKPFFDIYKFTEIYLMETEHTNNIIKMEIFIKPCINLKLKFLLRDTNDIIGFLNNKFDNFNHFKEYIINFSNCNEKEFEEWFKTFFSNNSYLMFE